MFRASNRIDIIDGIHLTAIAYSDASILAQRLNDRVFYQNTCSIPHPYTLADANHFISAVLAYERKNKVQRDWAIREATGSLIGGIGLLYSHGLDSHRSEMGYWLAIPYWNQGIMTAVIKQFYQHILCLKIYLKQKII